MEKPGLPQEALKVIACLTMLLDHIGVWLCPSVTLRIIGRIAFPLYCFLLVEGVHHTGDPRKYGLRLGLVLLLSELPFDVALFGGPTLAHQNVMLTLILGFLPLEIEKKVENPWIRLGIWGLAAVLAEVLHTDYGGQGVALILMFSLFRDRGPGWMACGVLAMSLLMNSVPVPFLGMWIPIEAFSVLAMIPISLYSGRKATHSRALQWAFTLFYPAHLAILALVRFL